MKYLSTLSFFLAYYSASMAFGFTWVLLSFSNSNNIDNGYSLADLLIAGQVAALIVGVPISTIMAFKWRRAISPFKRNIIITHPARCRGILYRILLPAEIVLSIVTYYTKHPLPLMFIFCIGFIVFLFAKGFIDWHHT